ncbi:MAG TPA: tRNA preQ1(34) S-adenosylmethionine ribosyltransferase-isomerase QueA [Succinivibrionaceae bacterium]|nr:tRNA preQ1(34) S-adenosylmethionine ribosyltransferase-isomerase QueA [Succinivibrionaceae bacterium]
MLRSDFNFELPRELIASYPSEKRTACRMLCLDGNTGVYEDKHFFDLKNFLEPGDLLVFNDTKVIPARIYGRKETGGSVELLVERILSVNSALTHMRASKAAKPGSLLHLDGGFVLKVTGRQGELFMVETEDGTSILDMLNVAGHIPLPPYIDRPDEPIDRERYQTVYSKNPGAVAAPTAGLHFDEEQLKELKTMGVEQAFVTLHVGAGTFQPVREDDIKNHHMHSEFVHLSEEVANKVIETHKNHHRVIAVGTTAVRSLESAAAYAKAQGLDREITAFSNDTSIFIYPGYEYKVVDCLITNFHLPESTLIMLVSAFAGYSHVMEAYRHAVSERYKFFSYGDCMFITKGKNAGQDLPPSAAAV